MFIAHIGAMDTFARGLRNVARMQEDGVLSTMLRDRYSTWGDGVGAKVPPCSSVASASGLTSRNHILTAACVCVCMSGTCRPELIRRVARRCRGIGRAREAKWQAREVRGDMERLCVIVVWYTKPGWLLGRVYHG